MITLRNQCRWEGCDSYATNHGMLRKLEPGISDKSMPIFGSNIYVHYCDAHLSEIYKRGFSFARES